MECAFPTIQGTSEEIKTILSSSKNIAIFGLSPNPEKDSHKVGKYLQEQGYKIFPIYPKEEEILGEKVYRSFSEIKEPIDIANIFRKPDAVGPIVDEILQNGGAKTLWLQLEIVNNEAAQKAKDAGMQVVQNKCTKIEHMGMA